MPEATDLLKSRSSVPAANLGEPGPSEAQIAEMLTIASRVPDHGKLTPWRFILFQGEARHQVGLKLAELRLRKEPEIAPGFIQQDKMRLASAPLVVAVVSRAAPHPKIPEWEQILSAGAAAMNLVLAAHALGFAANWVTGWIAYDPDAQKILGLKPHERIAAFVHVGTPTGPPMDRPRPPLFETVSVWKPD